MNYYVVSKFQESKLKYGIISKKEKLIVPFEYDYILIEYDNFICCKENKWGVIDDKLKVLIDFQYDSISMVKDYFEVKKNEFVGLFSLKGLEIIPVNFDEIIVSNNNYFIINQNGKVGVYDINSDLIPNEYDEIKPANSGFLARIEDKWGLLDDKNSILIEFKYKSLSDSDDKGFFIAKENNKFGYLNLNGDWLIRPLFDKAEMFDANDRAIVNVGYYSGLIDRKGCWIIKADAQRIKLINEVYSVRKYGILNIEKHFDYNGNETVLNEDINNIIYDENGFMSFFVDNKSGLKDKEGNIILPANYDYIISINKNLFICYLNGKMGILNSKGVWLLEPEFDIPYWQIIDGKGVYAKSNYCNCFFDFKKNIKIEFDSRYKIGYFDDEGYAITKANSEMYGLLFYNGEWKIPPIYDRLHKKDKNGLIKAYVDGKYGWIDINGNWIIQPDFDCNSSNKIDNRGVDFDDEILENILIRIDETFEKDNEFVFFEDEITNEQRNFFKFLNFYEARYLLFIDDSYKSSITKSGILLCVENGKYYIVLIEGCSKPIKIKLGNTISSQTLRNINYNQDTNALIVQFEKEFELNCSFRKILHNKYEPKFNSYFFYFYNNEVIEKFCEMIYEIINEVFVQE